MLYFYNCINYLLMKLFLLKNKGFILLFFISFMQKLVRLKDGLKRKNQHYYLLIMDGMKNRFSFFLRSLKVSVGKYQVLETLLDIWPNCQTTCFKEDILIHLLSLLNRSVLFYEIASCW